MTHTRREFVATAAAAVGGAALRPDLAWADDEARFRGFGLAPAGVLKPRASAAIAASPLGVGYETLDRQHFDPARTYAHAARLGIKWARCQTGWARCERVRGQYDFAWLDEVVDALLKIGIQPWFNLGYGNPLHTPEADATAVGWAPVFDETAMAAWLAYTKRLAEHFRGRVTHYEIWNEPNITAFWKPGTPDAASYARLVEQTAPVIRRQVPQAVIIGGAFSGMPMEYFAKGLDAGMARHVDKVAYHPYRSQPETNYESDVRAMRALLAQHGAAHIALWQGENGCPSKPGGAGALREHEWTEMRQAKWLLRRILSDLRLDVELTSYFLIVDLLGYRGSANWKGLLRGEDYSPKPAYSAYQNLCALFDAETRVAAARINIAGAGDATVLTAGFERRGQSLHVYWQAADLLKDVPPQPVGVTFEGRDQGQPAGTPALLDPFTGRFYRITSFDALPLADYPLIIADQSVFASA